MAYLANYAESHQFETGYSKIIHQKRTYKLLTFFLQNDCSNYNRYTPNRILSDR